MTGSFLGSFIVSEHVVFGRRINVDYDHGSESRRVSEPAGGLAHGILGCIHLLSPTSEPADNLYRCELQPGATNRTNWHPRPRS